MLVTSSSNSTKTLIGFKNDNFAFYNTTLTLEDTRKKKIVSLAKLKLAIEAFHISNTMI